MLKAKMLSWVGAGLLSAALVPGLGYAKSASRHKTASENQTKSSLVKPLTAKKAVKPTALKASSKAVPHRHSYRVSNRHVSRGRSRNSSRVAHHTYGKRHTAAVKTSFRSTKRTSSKAAPTRVTTRSVKLSALKHAPVKKTSKKIV